MKTKFYSDNRRNGRMLHNGQMRFFMASAVKKWPNFSKLAMKWPIWQPWFAPLTAEAGCEAC